MKLHHTLCAAILVCLSAFASDGWTELMQFRKPEGNLVFKMAGRPGVPPVKLRISGAERKAVINMGDGSWNISCTDDKGTGISLPAPVDHGRAENASEYEVLVKFREEWWAYYINGMLCGEMQAPMDLEGCRLEWPNDSRVQLSAPMDFQITARPSFQSDFMIEPGAKDELQPWKKEYGNWHIHTALLESKDRPETDQGTMKRTPPSADKSPNFYSLKGGGKEEDCLLTTGSDLFDNYTLTASLQPEGGEAGIAFLCRGSGKDTTFYALTLYRENDGEIRLWKYENGKRTNLVRVAVPLYDKQWYLPGVSLRNGEITATLDNALLFRYRGRIPANGRIGLFAKTPEETRFDDVKLSSNGDFALENENDLAANTVFATPGMVRLAEKPGEVSLPQAGFSFNVKAGETDEMLALGRAHCASSVFSARIDSEKAGLVAGWRGNGQPYYVFLRTRKGRNADYELIRFAPGGKSVLDRFSAPWRDGDELLVEISASGMLKCCSSDAMIFRRDDVKPGAAGLFVPAGSSAEFSGILMSRERKRAYERLQENKVFENDPFMRHWAAAEGQWIGGGGDIMYHKGDFFGDFNMTLPYLAGGEIHFGLADGAKEGALKLVLAEKEIKISGPDEYTETFAIAPQKADGTINVKLEGYWLDVSCSGKPIMSRRLEMPLREYGTRVLTRKYTSKIMEKSSVTRMNVIDDFFSESPHDWLVNGGDWQIINRFQCTASWSHMISHSLESMGAFWRKQRFEGDMTLEFYAGTRHGYYHKAGNMNCTIMAKDNTPSSGYTVTCSEWDHNNSQNWTVLYRNGIRMTRSDAYMVPRRRMGTYRRIHNPLIARGRDIHGAWYYMKLRKIGNKIEYWFDDELVMTANDDDVLKEGTLGIWTFDHSMTLAQIKITYEKMVNKQHDVKLLPAEIPAPAKPAAPEQWDATAGGFPLNAMESRYWKYSDAVAQGKAEQFALNTDGIMVVNNLGAGDMKISAELPALKLADVAGFRFRVKRTRGAGFNFFYNILSEDGKKIIGRYYHRISGTDFSRGPWKKTGETEIPVFEGALTGTDGWSDVTVWLPRWIRTSEAGDAKHLVKVGGFGLEQFDFMASGIAGNAPGDAYAVCDFRPIFYKRPEVVVGKDVRANARQGLTGSRPPMTMDAKVLAGQLEKCAQGTDNPCAYVDLNKGGSALTAIVEWLPSHDEADVKVEWADGRFDTVAVKSGRPYCDYRLENMKLKFNGADLKLIHDKRGDAIATAVIPRNDGAVAKFAGGKLDFELNLGKNNVRHFQLETGDAKRGNAPPALMKIDGFTPLWLGFEEETIPSALVRQGEPRMMFDHDPETGRHMIINNYPGNGGLRTQYKQSYSIAEYPVMFLRYNADDMCHVSLIYGHNYIRLGAQSSRDSRNVRFAKPLEQDGKWHSWLGFAADGFVNRNYNTRKYSVSEFTIGTGRGADQTGVYSRLKLDDIMAGPAVNSAENLAFTPTYFDFDGVERIEYAFFNGELFYDGRELNWSKAAPGAKIQPVLPKDVKDGLASILVRAVDKRGNISPVTQLPFLLDRKPPKVEMAVVTTDRPELNGKMLRIKVDKHGGAPLNLAKAVYKTSEKKLGISSWSNEYDNTENHDIAFLNYPFILRRQLDKTPDGGTVDFQMCGIEDGAGNKCPDHSYKIKVNFAGDKRGPSWHSLVPDDGYVIAHNWDGTQVANSKFFHSGGGQELRIVNEAASSPFLRHYGYSRNASLICNITWEPAKTPWMGFRLSTTTHRKNTWTRLVLTAEDNRHFIISLTAPSKEANELNTKQTFQWENNKWINFSFNVLQMLRDKKIPDADKIKFKSITFLRTGMKHRDNLQLDDFFIMGPPVKKRDCRIIAFDESGVASIDIYDGDAIVKTLKIGSDYYNLDDLRTDKLRWLRLIAKDKVGNVSIPCWLPIAPK